MDFTVAAPVLRRVSRSFYLSLRLLPGPMRDAAALGYLLARASDTIADAHRVDVGERLVLLARFRAWVLGPGEVDSRGFAILASGLDHAGEATLMERAGEWITWLRGLPEGEAALVREVVGTIVEGQRLDLTRFGNACPGEPACLADDAELEDYAWRVAGCVGEFWTRLGFLTMGDGFSRADPADLLEKGRAYGKGLQLVNILRDLPEDLAAGRCYLPGVDPRDEVMLLAERDRWLARAAGWLRCGEAYACELLPLRLRTASMLPAMIGLETLQLLHAAGGESLRRRVKVPRSRVRMLMLKALWSAR